MDGKTDYTVIIFNKMDHWLTHIYQYKFRSHQKISQIHAHRIVIFTQSNLSIYPPGKYN